jgi:hypothetical protein
VSKTLPGVLYKYIPVERCHHWLKERTIGFAALELLNDPYEGVILSLQHTGAGATDIWEDRPVIKYRIGNMDDYGVNPNYDPEARDRRVRAQEQLNHEIERRRSEALRAIRSCRILSLTRTPENMVMWAHYASNSRGLCIGIDWAKANLLVTTGARSDEPIKPVALAVEYKDYPFQSRFEHHEDPVAYALGRKHTDWAYEREIRMLRHASDFDMYAMGKKVGLLPLPPEAVTDIVFGASPDVSVRTMLRDHVGQFPGASIRQLEISSDSYSSRLREFRDV